MSGFIQLGADELSVGEGDGSVGIPITRTGDTSQPVTVEYRLDSESAVAGEDFTAQTGVILTTTIAAGANSVIVPVPITNDALSEATETFTISIVNIDSGTLLAPRTARVSILDDENPVTPPSVPPLISDYKASMQTVISGIDQPIDIDFSPLNPSIGYVSSKPGQIYAYDFTTGQQLSTVLDISEKVNDNEDRGLLGVALHPDLAHNPYLYAFYVVDPADTAGKSGNAGPDGGGNRFSYLSRFTLDESQGDLKVVPGSEVVLLGGAGSSLAEISGHGAVDSTSVLSQPASDVDPATGQYIQDYLKMDSRSHAGGGLAFGPDGMLYVSVGDGTSFNFADPRTISVQSVDSLSGKILRIDPLTGHGLADNPFVAPGDSLTENSSKVYELGLRNPFRIGFDDTGKLMISETGWNTWEEVDTGGPGANFGWPYFEGGDGGVSVQAAQYARVLPNSAAFYAAVADGTIPITAPFLALNHQEAAPGYQSNVIVGGTGFLLGGHYPASLQNAYLFTDFDKGEIYAVDVNNRLDVSYLTTTSSGFGPTQFVNGPDGYVYTADLIPGTISRLLVSEKGTSTGEVVVRWAAGPTTVAAIDGGPSWTADPTVVKGGPTALASGGITRLDASVSATAPVGLFANERYDPVTGSEMALDFGTNLAAGSYSVRLFMANAYEGTKTVGSRVFDVKIENQLAFDNVDLVARFGHKAGGMLEWQGQVTDGTVDIDFVHVVEDPLINGVEILRVGPALPAVTLAATPTTGSEAAGTQITLTATASAPVSGAQTVALSLSGAGVTGSDFVGVMPATLTIPDGATSASITLNVADDALVEGLETVTFAISNPSSGIALGATKTASVAITDDDSAPALPQVTLAATPATGSEAAGTEITLTATASAAVSGAQTVALSLGGTGLTADDFVGAIPATLTIPDGATSARVTLNVADDALVEGTETAIFTIANPSSGIALGATKTASVVITDNDGAPAPQVLFRWAAGTANVAAIDGGPAWVANPSLVHGGPTATAASAITSLGASVAAGTPLGLFATERYDPRTGAEMGLDFGTGLAAGTYTVRLFMGNGYSGTKAVGSRVFDVKIEDQLAFDNVDLVARFGHKTGGMLVWQGAVTDGTIDIDFRHMVEDPLINGVEILRAGTALPQVTLAATPTAGSEAAETQITLTATASAAVAGAQTVALSLAGTGVTASDFAGAIPATITIPNGANSASVTLNIADDALAEGVETARFTLSNPSSGIALGTTTTASVAITDNDTAATPQVLFRWAAGTKTVAAIDGGPAWTADATVVTGGPTRLAASSITNLHALTPSTTPIGLFATERYDPATGAEMGLHFGSGLADGDYTVRLFLGNSYSGTKTVGSRVFDVFIEDTLAFNDVDPVKYFGNKQGGMLEWTGEVTDGKIDIDFHHMVEDPLINGAEILMLA